ncbi:hypothetical protein KY310_01830 [Candidatus Woesearchaeota archaeon]|nr:hypothetical protein [Candidatus Woesearchaeota archaeon]
MRKLTALLVAMMFILSIVPMAFAQNETVNDTAPAEEPAEPTNDTAEAPVDDTPAEEPANETAAEEPAEEETPAEEPAETNATEEVAEEETSAEGNETVEVEVPAEEIEEAGTTPDSFLWNLDLALERLDLLLTFDESEEAKKELENARERLLEVQAMVAENDVEAAEEAQAVHDEIMADVEETLETMGNGDGEQELAEQVELEEKLNEHRMLVQKVEGNMLKTKGLTAEQQAKVQTMFQNMGETADGVKIQIQEKKNKTKIKIKAEKGMTDEEITALEEQVRAAVGEGKEIKITGHKPKKAKKEKGAAEEDSEDEAEDAEDEADDADESDNDDSDKKGKGKDKESDDEDDKEKGKPEKESKGKKK